MRNIEDLIKAVVVLLAGIAIMSTLATLPGGESYASLGKFLIIMAFLVGIISFLAPYIKRCI